MPLIDLNGLGHFKDKENAMIAEDFSASKAYAAGDYCYYNGTLYKFKTAHAAGAWTIADVEAAKLAHDVSDLKESTNTIYSSSNAPELYNTESYSDGSIVAGLSVIPDSIIESDTLIQSVQFYSTADSTEASIIIYGTISGKALFVQPVIAKSGWNTCEIYRAFEEPIKIAFYNTQPSFTRTTDAAHLFSANGLGRVIPPNPAVGDTLTVSKIYSGNFSLPIQWRLGNGIIADLKKQISELEQKDISVIPMFDKIICIGDSLTYSQVYTGASANRQAYKPYPKILASLCDCEGYIYATPGDTPILWWQRSSENAFVNHGLYIIFLGTNAGLTDTIETDCIGTDPNNFNKNTNTGAYGAILQTILNQNDQCVIIMPFGTSGDLPTTQNVINKFSEKYNFPIIEIDNAERASYEYHVYPDKTGYNALHFNDLGYTWMANEVKKQIDSLSLEDQLKIMRSQ